MFLFPFLLLFLIFLIFIFTLVASSLVARKGKDAGKRRQASKEKVDEPVGIHVGEITVQNCRTDDGRDGEEDKLGRLHDSWASVCLEMMREGYNRARRATHNDLTRIEALERSIQVSDLRDRGTDEHYDETVGDGIPNEIKGIAPREERRESFRRKHGEAACECERHELGQVTMVTRRRKRTEDCTYADIDQDQALAPPSSAAPNQDGGNDNGDDAIGDKCACPNGVPKLVWSKSGIVLLGGEDDGDCADDGQEDAANVGGQEALV